MAQHSVVIPALDYLAGGDGVKPVIRPVQLAMCYQYPRFSAVICWPDKAAPFALIAGEAVKYSGFTFLACKAVVKNHKVVRPLELEKQA